MRPPMRPSQKSPLIFLKSPCFAIILFILGAFIGVEANNYFYRKSLELQILELNAEKRGLEKDVDGLKLQCSALKNGSDLQGVLKQPPSSAESPAKPPIGSCKVLITLVPGSSSGRAALAHIEGRVEGLENPSRYKVLLYVHTDRWYVQPFADQPLTDIDPTGKWENETHLGQQYAALVVAPNYSPASAPEELPPLGAGAFAKAIVPANRR
jgi:hypothetical protein